MTKPACNCVAIETATERGSIAVSSGEQRFVIALDNDRTSSRQIFGRINGLLEEAGLTAADLDCIAYGCGPGSFTGVRVAASAAQGLAYARSIPVVSVSTLAALAYNAAADSPGIYAASLDARMGEAYVGIYELDGTEGLVARVADALVNPDVYRLANEGARARPVGPGWDAFPQMLDGNTEEADGSHWPEALAVIEIAQRKFATGEVLDAAEALPNYIRDKVTG